MGVPAPTTNLVVPPPKATPQVATGVVLDITGDRATVDVAGSPFQVKIPGSVLGVKEGRSVQIRSEGNSRTIVAVTTPLDPPNYTGSPSVAHRGALDDPPPAPVVSMTGYGYSSVASFSDVNIALAIIAGNIAEAQDGFDAVTAWAGPLIDNLTDVVNKLETMVQDLQDGTGIFK